MKLGEGTFGKVFAAEHIQAGVHVAIKTVEKVKMNKSESYTKLM